MNRIYLDNAATTALRPEVIEEMVRIMKDVNGNPSSTHSSGREARAVLEQSRKTIAKQLGCNAAEILFTSGATEANNLAIRSAIIDFKVERIITSKIEHHAVLHTAEKYASVFSKELEFVRLLPDGNIDLEHLESLLQDDTPTLVSLMHVNNEIGTVLDIQKVGNLCRKYNAVFHSDTVQSIGKQEFNLAEIPVDFIVASAHKFHGPKGVGFLYIRKGLVVNPMLFGGEQEKGRRAGTEGIHNIAGMSKALEISYSNLLDERRQIAELRQYTIENLKRNFPCIIHGDSQNGFYNILNVSLDFDVSKTSMLVFHLDMKGIAVSRGSACQSGSVRPSHVLSEIVPPEHLLKPSIRISFSHYNTTSDIDTLILALKEIEGA